MAYYRPRWHAHLIVPAVGKSEARIRDEDTEETFQLPLKVIGIDHGRNDHNQADDVTLELDWLSVGLDPRLIRNANVIVYYGNAREDGTWEISNSGGRTGHGNCRFVGTVSKPRRHSAEGSPQTLTLEAIDYTDYFLRAKPFGTNGIPDYSQTLDDAFRRVVSQTPGAERLADRLVKFGFDTW
ncbi:MAG TPA: hypothetical protein VHO25_06225, partial [Polyangiaceae bacterium]|nr:hypothetical protein [Polyangiaceae bacterium]